MTFLDRIRTNMKPDDRKTTSSTEPVVPRPRGRRDRRGAVVVEFALVLPIFMALLLGTIELGRVFEVSQILATAVREGARFASAEKEGFLASGQTANDKVVSDIRNFLTAAGLPGSTATIEISDNEDGGDFDLEDPNNSMKMFRIEISLPFDTVKLLPPVFFQGETISTHAVFRNNRSTLVNGG